MITGGHPLVELTHIRLRHDIQKFRLTNQNDLQKLFSVSLQIAQQAHLFQEIHTQILCLIQE